MLSVVLGVAAWTGAAASAATLTADTTVGDASISPGGSTTVTLSLTGSTVTTVTPSDLFLVLDESGSQSSVDFARTRNFAIDVVQGLAARDFFVNGGRVGVITFSSNALLHQDLSNSQSAVLTTLTGLGQRGGATCIGCGLDLARQRFDALSGAGRKRLAIVLTDGQNNVNTTTLANSVDAIKTGGAELFTVGVGGSVSVPELQSIASDPDATHVFTVDDFPALDGVVGSVVAAVVRPASTQVSITPTVASGFSVSSPVASKGSVSQSGNALTWTMDDVGAETVTLQYTITHDPADGCGTKAVHDSIGYDDHEGNTASFPLGSVDVVGCNHPPSCAAVAASTTDLGVPNHGLRPVRLSGATDPDGDPLTLTITGVTQDEPVNGLGDGDTGPDAVLGSASNEVSLRAERSGTGDGRVYRIAYSVDDGRGGTCTGVVSVGVRKAAGRAAVDSAPASYDSLTG